VQPRKPFAVVTEHGIAQGLALHAREPGGCRPGRVFRDYRAIVDACCVAWDQLVADPGRRRSFCHRPWIKNVSS
jgi:hypothetical protein